MWFYICYFIFTSVLSFLNTVLIHKTSIKWGVAFPKIAAYGKNTLTGKHTT
jgi:hypothetical protein